MLLQLSDTAHGVCALKSSSFQLCCCPSTNLQTSVDSIEYKKTADVFPFPIFHSSYLLWWSPVPVPRAQGVAWLSLHSWGGVRQTLLWSHGNRRRSLPSRMVNLTGHSGTRYNHPHYHQCLAVGSKLIIIIAKIFSLSLSLSFSDLGKDKHGYGFGGTAKKSCASQFDDYGEVNPH